MQAASAPGPEQAECKSATDNTIFDHIHKKSKEFPTPMVSKSMDSSYEPLILKKMKISRDQFEVEHGCLHADEATTMDFEPVEPRVAESWVEVQKRVACCLEKRIAHLRRARC
jgi:ATP-dependent DNA helicase HFM1/MER3